MRDAPLIDPRRHEQIVARTASLLAFHTVEQLPRQADGTQPAGQSSLRLPLLVVGSDSLATAGRTASDGAERPSLLGRSPSLLGRALVEDLHEPETGAFLAARHTLIDTVLANELARLSDLPDPLPVATWLGPDSIPLAPDADLLVGHTLAAAVRSSVDGSVCFAAGTLLTPSIAAAIAEIEGLSTVSVIGCERKLSAAPEPEMLTGRILDQDVDDGEIRIAIAGTAIDTELAEALAAAGRRRRQLRVREGEADSAVLDPLMPQHLLLKKLDEEVRDPESDALIAPAGTIIEDLKLARRVAYACWRRSRTRVRQPPAGDAAWALIEVFSHLVAHVIQRLNRLPEKNRLAFLDWIGTRREPPRTARAPLTFTLAEGSPRDVRVAAGTAASATGDGPPAVFTTEEDLVVTRARLAAACVHEPTSDRFRDVTALATGVESGTFDAFRATEPTPHEHLLYIGHADLLGRPGVKILKLSWVGVLPEDIEWQHVGGSVDASVSRDQSIVDVTLNDVPPIPVTEVDGVASSWLALRRTTRPETEEGALSVASITVEETFVTADSAWAAGQAVELSQEFLAFGERPRRGDAFYLAADDLFARSGEQVKVVVDLELQAIGEPHAGDSMPSAELSWEYWNGRGWQALMAPKSGTHAENLLESGEIALTVPADLEPVEIQGEKRRFIRARLAANDYGTDVHVRSEEVENRSGGDDIIRPPKVTVLVPSTLRVPRILSLHLSYSSESAAVPEHLVSYNDFIWERHAVGQSFIPFRRRSGDPRPALYLGFEPPDGEAGWSAAEASLYFQVIARAFGEADVEPGSDGPETRPMLPADPGVEWQVAAGENGGRACWQTLPLRDDTEGLRRPGVVSFSGPSDLLPSSAFGRRAVWLRALWTHESDVPVPRLGRILTNTVLSRHVEKIADEILGSATGEPDQSLATSRHPVLPGQVLEVRESASGESHDGDALGTFAGGTWRPWQEVPHFHFSEHDSLHYTLDRLSGEIRFGDGLRGRIPPTGHANVRLTYETGGGAAGNRPAGTITQLKSAVPGIAGVTNHSPAVGGAEAESIEQAVERGPQRLRHRGRAVTLTDYEDLAREVAAEIVRVRALDDEPGRVTLVVLPEGEGPRPDPSLELLDRVHRSLTARMAPTVELRGVGPDWLQVSVDVEVVPRRPDKGNEVAQSVRDILTTYLHPVRGSSGGRGWDFGERPLRTDLHRLLERLPEVDHLRRLELREDPLDSRPERFLVCSGEHQVVAHIGDSGGRE